MAPAKATGALLSIGEVASVTGIPQHVLRYWEARLPQLSPLKRAGGRRFYRPEDVALVQQIQRLIDQDGFTMDGAAKALRRDGHAPVSGTLPNQTDGIAVPTDLISQLHAIRHRLARALS